MHLQGYSLGNAVTDQRFDGNALLPFARGHSLISPALAADAERACGGEYWNATKGGLLPRSPARWPLLRGPMQVSMAHC